MFSRISKRLLPILLVLSLLVPMAVPTYAAATGTHTPVEGVTVSVSGATDNSMTDGAVTVTAKGSAGFLGIGASAKTATITIYNDSADTATLSFNWAATSVNNLKIDGTVYTGASGTFSKVMAAGTSITATITTAKNSTVNKLVMSNFALAVASASSNVTFDYDSALGSVTVDGTAVAAGGTTEIAIAGAALVATPVSGASFLGWTNTDGTIISKNASYTLVPANDMTVNAIFVNSASIPYFYANSGTHLIGGLAEAASFASTASTKVISLANNATLAAGDYTIPAGVILHIPFDAANTVYTTSPGANEITSGSSNEVPETPYAFRQLSLASGANITVNGSISLSARHQSGGLIGGAPEGPCGFIKMASDSNITVNSGANLYAWGYIVGSGNVTAKSGATVYENFQVHDWMGGNVTSSMATDTTYGVFPMSQYYVQNIEVPFTIEAGAVEYGLMSETITMIGIQTISVPYIGTGSSMFNVISGSILREYDGSVDRNIYTINGNMEINPITMSMKLGILGSSTIKTANYELPITNNMTINVESGTITLNQDAALLPGAVLNISKDATCIMGQGVNLYIYDSAEWAGYTTPANVKFSPIRYAYSKTYTRTEADLVDAEINVNGTVDASKGYVYTTASGANIHSTDTATLMFQLGSQTETYQKTYDATNKKAVYHAIEITNALLKNGDGTIFTPDIDDTYTYANGVWTGTACRHSYELTASTDATCTAAGSKTYTCSLCGDSYTEEVAALGHTEVVDAAVAPTCTETGLTEGKHCSVCGTVTVAQTVVAALGHTEVIDAAVAPTCTATGLTEGKHCSVCNEVLTAQTVVAALGHSYDAVVTAPTCTEAGYTTYTCSVCGDTYVSDTVEANGHTEGEAVVEKNVDPTCTEAGSYETVVYCAVCEAELSRVKTTVEALGHSYDAVVTAPTCTEAGYTTYTCSVCGDTYVSDTVEANGHTEGEAVTENEVDATCTEAGSYETVVYCAVCEAELSRVKTTVEALGHSYEVTDVVAPTCTVNGYTVYTCSVCGDSYNADPVDAEGHPYEAVVTEPTCTEGGYTTYTCAVCGDTYVADETEALGHTEVIIPAVAPTCTEEGSTEGKYCDVCGEVITAVEVVAPNGHSYEVTDVVAPTCTVNGYTVYTCSVCGDSYNADPVDAEGHKYRVTDVVAPTCTESGYSVYTCEFCGDSYKADPTCALDHAYDAIVTEPTCTEGGYTTYVCSVCGDSYVADETEALGHTEVVIPAVAPTCTEEGSTEGKYCEVCGEVLVAPESVAPNGHSFGEWYTTVEPTTEAAGEERRDCANCDAYEVNELPMIEVDP
ncbi:MAG: hypothetical protein E7591_09615, partial [Ruminococcaceae bacterium]|nr:hypothetical protein [Oscillospiraceae bacterium]